jgi:hypothetical protein
VTSSKFRVSIALGLLAAGCTGQIDGPPSTSGMNGAPPGGAGGPACTGVDCGVSPDPVPGSCDGLTPRRLRRLSGREYANVVTDLLGASAGAQVTATLPFEPRLAGFDNQDSALFVSASFQEALANLAEKVAAEAEPSALAPCATPSGDKACLDSFMSSFGAKAYGRPLAADELARLSAVAALGQDYATSVRLVVELVLQSPHFVYVSELGAVDAVPTPGQPIPLTSYEIASQLSFLLSGRRPDDALRQAAGAGLASVDDIQREAARMLEDPRALTELRRYVLGWLDMEDVAHAPKSAEAFPPFTEDVAAAMQRELDDFVDAQLKGPGTIQAFLTGTPATVAPALLPIYGADYDAARGFDPQRRVGILSLPGFLTYHASHQHSGPVERGLLVRRQLLCTDIPPPPATVLERIANNPIDNVDQTKTTRQKFQVHLDDTSCVGCHRQFDPIGFGMEDMDGIGRYRTQENGLPVDSSGELTGTDVDGAFNGVAQLSAKLARSERVQACAVEHFFRFAMARPAEDADQCVVNAWASAFAQSGGKIKDLVTVFVADEAFAIRKDDR